MWLLWSVSRDVLENKRHLFTEDVQKNCLHVLADMKQSAHTYLLKPVHDGLKVSLFTTDSKAFFILIVNSYYWIVPLGIMQIKINYCALRCYLSNASWLCLTQPQYRKLGTSDWLNKNLFEKLLLSIENELQDLQGSVEPCHQVDGRKHKTHSSFNLKEMLLSVTTHFVNFILLHAIA